MTTALANRATVLLAIDAYVEMANAHPSVPSGYSYVADPSGSKYRIVMVDSGGRRSVHSFVDLNTGDLLKAAGWKAAAKGVRYNLLDEMELVAEMFDWAGGYLYAGARKDR
jgi:hypothetical protein